MSTLVQIQNNNTALVLVETPKLELPSKEWGKQSLRRCLHVLGISDSEMRYRKGVRAIVTAWTGEVNALKKLIHDKWKSEVVKYHEAINGGYPEKWKLLNTVYSAALKKIAPYIRKNKTKYVSFECMICGQSFSKKIVSWVQHKSSLCSRKECKLEYYRRRSRKQRARQRVLQRKRCANPNCDIDIFTSNAKRKFCGEECRKTVWKNENLDRIKESTKISHAKRKSWKDRYATLTEEQKEEHRKKHLEQVHRRLENESPEKRALRQVRLNAYARAYRAKRAAEGRPIINTYIPKKEWLEKKRLQLIDKPWIYETILMKHSPKSMIPA